MLQGLLTVLPLLAALGSGVVAGVFFAFSSFVIPALARLPPAQGVLAMQSINQRHGGNAALHVGVLRHRGPCRPRGGSGRGLLAALAGGGGGNRTALGAVCIGMDGLEPRPDGCGIGRGHLIHPGLREQPLTFARQLSLPRFRGLELSPAQRRSLMSTSLAPARNQRAGRCRSFTTACARARLPRGGRMGRPRGRGARRVAAGAPLAPMPVS